MKPDLHLPGQHVTIKMKMPDGVHQPRQYGLTQADDGRHRQFAVKGVRTPGPIETEASHRDAFSRFMDVCEVDLSEYAEYYLCGPVGFMQSVRCFPSLPVSFTGQSLIFHAGVRVLTGFMDILGFGRLGGQTERAARKKTVAEISPLRH
ncbi:hypothetical protein NFC73_01910 [Pseudarthrobacter sp. RMG13]|uniref:Uncharacterized protein n=1 Tax=Pseudarthrobacter humi TaxID=2952523 RepID=A0ABT1LJ77_9MICC|nr:hypothetical protein [Pseudarthrobacter humi]MCP8998494.1 hypothetical protein [Pseudarthrobacter humi]